MKRSLQIPRQRRRQNPRKRAKSLRILLWSSSSMTSLTHLQIIWHPPRKSKAIVDYCSACVLFCCLKLMMCLCRLQDLSDRDMAKQEREKTLNSLEAFIFETQVTVFYVLPTSEESCCQLTSFENTPYDTCFSRTSCTRRNTCWWCQKRTSSRSPLSSARCLSGWMRTATLLPPSSFGRSCLR